MLRPVTNWIPQKCLCQRALSISLQQKTSTRGNACVVFGCCQGTFINTYKTLYVINIYVHKQTLTIPSEYVTSMSCMSYTCHIVSVHLTQRLYSCIHKNIENRQFCVRIPATPSALQHFCAFSCWLTLLRDLNKLGERDRAPTWRTLLVVYFLFGPLTRK